MTQQEQIDRLAVEFMKWHRNGYIRSGWYDRNEKFAASWNWNPFRSHDDAHDLLEECEERGLERKYIDAKMDILRSAFYAHPTEKYPVGWVLEMATPEQITNAVWVVAGLEGKANG